MSKIDVSGWKEFKVTNLLNWYHGRRRKRNDLDLVDFEIKPNLVGYLTAGFENQGAIGSCNPTMFSDETDAIFNRSITIDMFGNSFFHTYPCAGDDNVYFLTSDKYSDNQMLFLTGTINSITSSKFGYKDQFRQHNLETLTIKLPVTSTSEPDWNYMDEYIEKLATQARKNVSSLAMLKSVEHKIDIKAWKEFKVGKLFDVDTGVSVPKLDLDANPGNVPRISVTNENNGVIGYYDDKADLPNIRYFTNFISVNFFGKAFYHPGKASVEMKVHVLKLKDREFTPKLALFFTNILNKYFSKDNYGYGNQLSSSKLKSSMYQIPLPVTSTGQPDFDYMEKYIDNMQNKVHESLELLKQI